MAWNWNHRSNRFQLESPQLLQPSLSRRHDNPNERRLLRGSTISHASRAELEASPAESRARTHRRPQAHTSLDLRQNAAPPLRTERANETIDETRSYHPRHLAQLVQVPYNGESIPETRHGHLAPQTLPNHGAYMGVMPNATNMASYYQYPVNPRERNTMLCPTDSNAAVTSKDESLHKNLTYRSHFDPRQNPCRCCNIICTLYHLSPEPSFMREPATSLDATRICVILGMWDRRVPADTSSKDRHHSITVRQLVEEIHKTLHERIKDDELGRIRKASFRSEAENKALMDGIEEHTQTRTTGWPPRRAKIQKIDYIEGMHLHGRAGMHLRPVSFKDNEFWVILD